MAPNVVADQVEKPSRGSGWREGADRGQRRRPRPGAAPRRRRARAGAAARATTTPPGRCRASGRAGRPAASMSRNASTRRRATASAVSPRAIQGMPSRRTTRSGGTRTSALIAALAHALAGPAQRPKRRVRRAYSARAASKAARSEVRPEHVAEVELGVGRLPDQEVQRRCSPPVRISRSGSGRPAVYSAPEMAASSIPRAARPLAATAPDRVHELRPAGVVERDVEHEAVAAGGRREGGLDRGPRLGRQLLETAEEADPDALPAQLRRSRRGWRPRGGRTAR